MEPPPRRIASVPQPFDITLKHLLEAHPADCLRLIGLSTAARVEAIDADLATVMAEADKVLCVHDSPPWLVHLELQASYDANLPERVLRYNVLLKNRHALPVHSAVILLRPEANGPEMTGVVRHLLAGKQYLEFHYQVLRIWQQPVEAVVAGGVGTLPLAPLADLGKADLPDVIRWMRKRFRAEVEPGEEAQLWTATYVLMGLRYDKMLAAELLRGVRDMEESVTYQAIVEKGKAEGIAKGMAQGMAQEAQRILLRIGTKELGTPDASTKAAIANILDRDHLEALIDRVSEVKDWQALLGKPRSRRANGRTREKR
jgi:predicted transposase YdaD